MHAWQSRAVASRLLRPVLDFALPPRCGGCGAIVDEVDSFCAECWTKIEFLGSGGCAVCGLPLEGDRDRDLRRAAWPGRRGCSGCGRRPLMARSAARSRSASNMGARSRSAGRWRASWRRCSASLPDDALLVPVPLHRRPDLAARLQPVGDRRSRACPPHSGPSFSARRASQGQADAAAQGAEHAASGAGRSPARFAVNAERGASRPHGRSGR